MGRRQWCGRRRCRHGLPAAAGGRQQQEPHHHEAPSDSPHSTIIDPSVVDCLDKTPVGTPRCAPVSRISSARSSAPTDRQRRRRRPPGRPACVPTRQAQHGARHGSQASDRCRRSPGSSSGNGWARAIDARSCASLRAANESMPALLSNQPASERSAPLIALSIYFLWVVVGKPGLSVVVSIVSVWGTGRWFRRGWRGWPRARSWGGC